MEVLFSNSLPRRDITLGILIIEGVSVGKENGILGQKFKKIIETRKTKDLTSEEESIRSACRDILRNGNYKPTGRGKPSSEFLLRAAREDQFPQVNSLVDIANCISLKYGVPLSIWDLGLLEFDEIDFRLGKESENYVFNHSGQELKLNDLLIGCLIDNAESTPIINPIKDSMRTKISETTKNIAAVIYFPSEIGNEQTLEKMLSELFHDLLLDHSRAKGEWGLLHQGEKEVLCT